METSKEEIAELGAVIFKNAGTIAETINKFGVGLIACTDEKHKYIMFKTLADKAATTRIGDVFMVDVPGIDKKYKKRERREKKDEVRNK